MIGKHHDAIRVSRPSRTVNGVERGSRAPGRLPNYLIVGAMKSGTTSLARYLGAHPEVFMPLAKEIHFFNRNFERGVDWYKQQFSEATNERAIGEATPGYMADEEAPSRMADLLPDARLIAILRDPVERAYSHYWHNRARGREDLGFLEALSAERERMAQHDRQRGNFAYFGWGRYVHQLMRLEKHYGRDAMLVSLFEDLRDRPKETYQSVCRFLGVDDSIVPANVGKRMGQFQNIRSTMLRNITRPLPRRLRNAIGRVNAPFTEYPPLDPAVRSELGRRYEADNEALASWLGRDLSCWRT